jgi:hypothetical protein
METNLENIDALSARYRTLNYENERLQKAQTTNRAANGRLHNEVEGWKAKCADLEKRLFSEELKVKELREESARGRKALEGVRVAALVSHLLVSRAQSIDIRKHEGKKSQTRMDKAQAQLTRLSNDASIATRAHGLVILNPIRPGRDAPMAVSYPAGIPPYNRSDTIRRVSHHCLNKRSEIWSRSDNLSKKKPKHSDMCLYRLGMLYVRSLQKRMARR